MTNVLVQVVDSATGERSWVRTDTGEVAAFQRPTAPTRAPVGEMLFQSDPDLHDKLMRGAPLTWPEVSRAADTILRAVSQDSLRVMFLGASMREIRSAIETMLKAQKLCNTLNPRLKGSPIGAGDGRAASGAMRQLLTLPGQR